MTAYELRISDWSSDVCSSDLRDGCHDQLPRRAVELRSHSGKQFSRRFGLTLSLPSFPAALPVVDFFGGVPGGPGGRWPASLSRQLLPGALTSLAWLGRCGRRREPGYPRFPAHCRSTPTLYGRGPAARPGAPPPPLFPV